MAIIGDALRQAFMPKHEYERLHEEEKAWGRLQRPLVTAIVVILWTAVIVSTFISVRIVFPGDDGNRPFCHGRERRIEELEANASSYSEAWDFSMTEDEVVGIYWVVVFFPSAIVFSASAIYLLAGIAVAYSAPSRHGCLKVVENNYCASRRGIWMCPVPLGPLGFDPQRRTGDSVRGLLLMCPKVMKKSLKNNRKPKWRPKSSNRQKKYVNKLQLLLMIGLEKFPGGLQV